MKKAPQDYWDHNSGKMTIRMPVHLHKAIAATAEQQGVSINLWIVTALALAAGAGLLGLPSICAAIQSAFDLGRLSDLLANGEED